MIFFLNTFPLIRNCNWGKTYFLIIICNSVVMKSMSDQDSFHHNIAYGDTTNCRLERKKKKLQIQHDKKQKNANQTKEGHQRQKNQSN